MVKSRVLLENILNTVCTIEDNMFSSSRRKYKTLYEGKYAFK